MNQRFYGSICVSDLLDYAHKKHSAFTKGENGKIYASVNIWLNDSVDKFGNIMSAQLNPKKEQRELDGQPYIGNFKEAEAKPITARDTSGLSLPDDIPVAEKSVDKKDPKDDLPF